MLLMVIYIMYDNLNKIQPEKKIDNKSLAPLTEEQEAGENLFSYS